MPGLRPCKARYENPVYTRQSKKSSATLRIQIDDLEKERDSLIQEMNEQEHPDGNLLIIQRLLTPIGAPPPRAAPKDSCPASESRDLPSRHLGDKRVVAKLLAFMNVGQVNFDGWNTDR